MVFSQNLNVNACIVWTQKKKEKKKKKLSPEEGKKAEERDERFSFCSLS